MTVKRMTETARILSIKKTESRLDEISEKTASRFTTLTFGIRDVIFTAVLSAFAPSESLTKTALTFEPALPSEIKPKPRSFASS